MVLPAMAISSCPSFLGRGTEAGLAFSILARAYQAPTGLLQPGGGGRGGGEGPCPRLTAAPACPPRGSRASAAASHGHA